MRRIAVYGKGGIGKSTISSNLSVAMSRRGCKVLQIGCDPKHDSTRLLLHGKRLTTVLDYMKVTAPLDRKVEDVLEQGYAGIGCVEAGGPKPGVGCAGRGIISTFEMLNEFRLDDHYDVTVYDVLGDVVCGGFAVPIRREYADTILVVTSGEFMALYAANNILRGIRNYDGDQARVAGLVYNQRNVEGEDERVAAFAKAVGLPVFATVPRSDAFTRAEHEHVTVMERGDSPQVCSVFEHMAQELLGSCQLYTANPLTDDELELTVLGTNAPCEQAQVDAQASADGAADTASAAADGQPSVSETGNVDLANPNRYLSKNVIRHEPLHGCAFNGALNTAVHLNDAVVLAHSPKSCTYISYQTISSTGRRRLFERGQLLPVSLAPNLECSEMDQSDIVFGGMDALEDKVRQIMQRQPAPTAIAVVSSCPAGIIGDDIDRIAQLSTPQTAVVPIRTDGNMSGDYMQGMFMTYTSLARGLIRRDVPKVKNTVNIIAEKMVVTNTQQNFELVQGFLAQMGISVNCRFLYDTSTQSLRDFCSAELNLPAYSDFTATTMANFFLSEYDMPTFELGFPIGYDETCRWLRAVGQRFGKQQVAEQIIQHEKLGYEQQIAALRPSLEGKKLMVITFNSELDWILKTALDLGMRIVKIAALDYSQDEGFRSRLDVDLPIELCYDPARRADDLQQLQPDVLLTNYASSVSENVPVSDTIPMCPDAGFDSGLVLARRWERLMRLDIRGEWEQDEQLFDRYYTR